MAAHGFRTRPMVESGQVRALAKFDGDVGQIGYLDRLTDLIREKVGGLACFP